MVYVYCLPGLAGLVPIRLCMDLSDAVLAPYWWQYHDGRSDGDPMRREEIWLRRVGQEQAIGMALMMISMMEAHRDEG